MATTTEKGFQIPGYADKADVPGMVKDNVETAEEHLKAISKSMSDISSNINSLDSTLQIMNAQLGTMSETLDEVNGVTEETYINSQTSSESIDIIIPNGELWIMGDNRGHSTDSRHFGTVELGDVLGVVILKKHKDLED